MKSLGHRINILRRKVTHKLTKSVGRQTDVINLPFQFGKDQIKNILICRPNHRLGNLLLITPLLQEVENTFPNCKIDLFVKGNAAADIFRNYKSVNRIFALPRKPFKNLIAYINAWMSVKRYRYDLVINVEKNSSSGRLITQYANATYKYFGDPRSIEGISDYEHFAKYPVYGLREYLERLGFPKNVQTISSLDLRLDAAELAHGRQIVSELSNENSNVICLFTHATGNKCYPETWWIPIYERLQKEYPEYAIIEILPIENVSQINFLAKTFYSHNIRDMGAVIANTSVFIGADSGILHLASSVNIPVIGLFSVFSPDKYGPYGNHSVSINTKTTDADAIFTSLSKILQNSNTSKFRVH